MLVIGWRACNGCRAHDGRRVGPLRDTVVVCVGVGRVLVIVMM